MYAVIYDRALHAYIYISYIWPIYSIINTVLYQVVKMPATSLRHNSDVFPECTPLIAHNSFCRKNYGNSTLNSSSLLILNLAALTSHFISPSLILYTTVYSAQSA